MVVIRTRGCEYAIKNNGGCTVCGFINHADTNITDAHMLMQLEYALNYAELDGVEEVDLLTLGSLLNDREICPQTRRELLQCISGIDGIRRVSFESRAEYVTLDKLQESKKILGDRIVELGIGLESADDHVRNNIIKKGLSKDKFERVVALLKDASMDLLVYILVKAPHLSEQSAIEDALGSIEYVFKVAERIGINARVALEPVFITQNTYLEKLFLDSSYKLVNLWSVVDIIIRSHDMGNIFVGLSDEDLSSQRTAHSCHRCAPALMGAIEEFNRTQEIDGLLALDCRCKADYLRNLKDGSI
jgi:radical SAM enzyme (TIGR01210 family)